MQNIVTEKLTLKGEKTLIRGTGSAIYHVSYNRLGQVDVCSGDTVPTGAGIANIYAKGCLFTKENAGAGVAATYENTGTAASPSFTLIATAAPGTIGLTANHTLVGSATNTAADSSTLTVVTPATTVNTVQITGAATGNAVAIAGIGTDAAVNVLADGKGAGTVGINTVSTTAGLVTIGNSTSKAGVAINGGVSATSASANALAVGPNPATTPAFRVNCVAASSATGVGILTYAAAGGVDIYTSSTGLNESMRVDAKGSGTVGINTTSTTAGVVQIGNGTAKGGVSIQGSSTINDATTGALVVGPNGTTNPALRVDTSTATSATGIQIKSAAAAAGVAISVISSGAAENLTLNALGTGTIGIGSVSTGAVTVTPALTATGGLTIGGALIQGGTGAITASSGAGAVAITGQIHEVTTTATGNALTLANGTAGQRLSVIYVAEAAGADTAVLTPTTLAGTATTITFNALGDAVDLVYSATGGWYIVGQNGVTVG